MVQLIRIAQTCVDQHFLPERMPIQKSCATKLTIPADFLGQRNRYLWNPVDHQIVAGDNRVLANCKGWNEAEENEEEQSEDIHSFSNVGFPSRHSSWLPENPAVA